MYLGCPACPVAMPSVMLFPKEATGFSEDRRLPGPRLHFEPNPKAVQRAARIYVASIAAYEACLKAKRALRPRSSNEERTAALEAIKAIIERVEGV